MGARGMYARRERVDGGVKIFAASIIDGTHESDVLANSGKVRHGICLQCPYMSKRMCGSCINPFVCLCLPY